MGENITDKIPGGPGPAYVNQDGPSHRLIQLSESELRRIRTYIGSVAEVDGEEVDDEEKVEILALIDAALTA